MLGSYLARMALTLAREATKRAHVLDETRFSWRVWPTDVDTYVHVNNGRFLTLMDIGRWSHSLRTGLAREAVKRGWRPVVAGATLRFRRELRLFERAELVTRVAYWDERSFYVEHRVERDGVVHVDGFVRAVNRIGGQRARPSEMFAAVGYDGPSPEPSPELAKWMETLR